MLFCSDMKAIFFFLIMDAPCMFGIQTPVSRASFSETVLNDCADLESWIIRFEPDPAADLRATPYALGRWGNPMCESDLSNDTNNNGVPEYVFDMDITRMECGMKQHSYPDNATFELNVVLPSRQDGIEVHFDHLLTVQCKTPQPFLHPNQTTAAVSPEEDEIYTAIKDLIQEKQDELIVNTETGEETDQTFDAPDNVTGFLSTHGPIRVDPPSVVLYVTRDGVPIESGQGAFLGEQLAMEVRVVDLRGLYTKVKVEEFWATYENNPLAPVSLPLISNGCHVDTAGALIRKFEKKGESDSVIEAFFFVFRFPGHSSVHFWLTVTTCPFMNNVDCDLRCLSRRRRDVIPAPRGLRRFTRALSSLAHFSLRILEDEKPEELSIEEYLIIYYMRESGIEVCAKIALLVGIVGSVFVVYAIIIFLLRFRTRVLNIRNKRLGAIRYSQFTMNTEPSKPKEVAPLSMSPAGMELSHSTSV